MIFQTALLGILLAVSALAAPKLVLKPVVEGFTDPVDVALAPGEPNRLYVVEQEGKIRVVENGKLLPAPFLDIVSKVRSAGEMGLLGLAFHPGYAKNRRYFVNYTAKTEPLKTVVSEFKAGSDAELKLITFDQPFTNHNGGEVIFGPDGYLYIGTGDGGSAGDPFNNGQNKDVWLGKILRIDVNKGTPYGIPPDNPFAKGGGKKEVYAYGLRNPWRFSFDPKTKLLYAGDVGQNRWEEIHVIEKGGNHGWNIMEGNHCYTPPNGCKTDGLVPAIHEYGRRDGISITGGVVYRGKKIPELDGMYLYADFGSGKLWGLKYDEKAKKVLSNELLLSTHQPIASFGYDADGEVLVVIYHGTIARLEKAK